MYPKLRYVRPAVLGLFLLLFGMSAAAAGASFAERPPGDAPFPGPETGKASADSPDQVEAHPAQEPNPDPRTPEQVAAWSAWDALPPATRAKVDARILAELKGEVRPAHLPANPLFRNRPQSQPRTETQTRTQTRFIVHLQQQADLDAIARRRFSSRAELRQTVFAALQQTANQSQRSLKAFLDRRSANGVSGYQPFVIINALAVEADLNTIIALAQRPDVVRISGNYPVIPVPTEPENHDPIGTIYNWNTKQVRANLVWSDLGVRGEGAVVGSFDSGVNATHPALQKQYRGGTNGTNSHDYNWFEPDARLYPGGDLGPSVSDTPYDCTYSDHGTHTTGTMVGFGEGLIDGEIGMAPDAKWIAVPGICIDTMPGGIQDDIGGLKAFQWFLCPTDLTGDLASADCSKAPDVINNSWGSANPVDDTFRPVLKALRAAGVAPVFAAGNPEAGPGSIGAPANIPEAITVGATDIFDEVTDFSARGPSFYENEQKPEFSAPGWFVRSAVGSGSYSSKSGTSMAAPHVAGLIALMVSADLQDGFRDYNIDELEALMAATAVDAGPAGPDGSFGYGRIDAYEAVRAVLTAGDLQGTVRNGTDGTPIPGVQITATEAATGNRFSAQTGPNGSYALTVPGGTFTLAFRAWGYEPFTYDEQQVLAGTLSFADFDLSPHQRHHVSGRVTSAGQPAAGVLVQVAAQPAYQTFTDGNGQYSLELPAGQHDLWLEGAGYRSRRAVFNVDVTTVTDIEMEPAPRILLVDASASGGWFFGWPLHNIFDWALTQERYVYDLWRIQDPDINGSVENADGSKRFGVPSVATLSAYDVVIWYHSACDGYTYDCSYGFPAAINADDELSAYLDQGGRLILSGQDLGMGDGEDPIIDRYLEADMIERTAADTSTRITGHDFLKGLNLPITNAGLYGYANGAWDLRPDAVVPAPNSANAFSILTYDNQAGPAGLAVAPCDQPYRAVYLAVGYENIAPRAADRSPEMAALLGRTIRWLQAPREPYSYNAISRSLVQQGRFDTTAIHDVRVINLGNNPLSFQVQIEGQTWPTELLVNGQPASPNFTLSSCASRQLQIAVKIPELAELGAEDEISVQITPQDRPELAPYMAHFTTRAMPEWEAEPEPATNRWTHGIAAVPGANAFHVVGGTTMRDQFDDYGYETALHYRYNACGRAWQNLAPLPAPRDALAVAALGERIFAAGGANTIGTRFFSEAYIYEPTTDSWTQVASMPQPLAAGAAVAIGGKVYVFGGYVPESGSQNSTLMYDPAADTWSERAPMPGGSRYFLAAAALAGKAYVFGSSFESNRLEIYDPVTDTWSTGSRAAMGRGLSTLAAGPDGHLYLMGGASDYDFSRFVERYDPVTDTWQVLDGLQGVFRLGAASTFVGGRLFLNGGLYGAEPNQSLTLSRSFCESGLKLPSNVTATGGSVQVDVLLAGEASPATNASFSSAIPATLDFAGFLSNEIGAQWNEQTRQVTWVGPLPNEQARLNLGYRLSLKPAALSAGDLFTVEATIDNGQGTRFNSGQRVLVAAPDLSASQKRTSASAVVGGERVTYTIEIASATAVGGPAQMIDRLPALVNMVPDSLQASAGTVSYDPSTNAVTWSDDFSTRAAGYANTADDYLWGDSDGEGNVPGVKFDWIDIRSPETFLMRGSLQVKCNVPIGFAFPYYGEAVDTLCVDTGGLLALDEWTYSRRFPYCPLPDRYLDYRIIAGVWDRLNVKGGIYVKTIGSAPNRALVVQWDDVVNERFYFDRPGLNFQIVLYESGLIRVNILTVESLPGTSSTTGLQHSDSIRGVTYACEETDSIHDELSIAFLPPGGMANQPAEQVTFAVAVANDVANDSLITNSAIITGPNDVYTRSATITANPVDLGTSEKRVTPVAVTVGQPVRYDIILRNTGLTKSTANLEDSLPLGVTYEAGSLTCSAGACLYDDRTVRWTGEILPSSQVTITFSGIASKFLSNNRQVTNTARLIGGRAAPMNLSATFTARRSDLSSSYFATSPLFGDAGAEINMTLYLRNNSVEPASANARFPLPAGFIYKAGTLYCGAGTCRFENGAVLWNGNLPPRALIPVRFRVQLPANVAPGDLLAGIAEITDTTWNVNYLVPMELYIAHHLYGATISNGMALPHEVYLPMIPNGR